MAPNVLKHSMFIERRLKLLKRTLIERSSYSSGNDDEDMIQPVQLLPILKEGIGVFLPKHMC